MAQEDPNCPRCTGPVREDWDWCQNCGYDPEGLKPMGWIPAPPPVAEPVSRRRARRARNAEHAASRSGGSGSAPAALLTLPPDIVDLTRIDRRVDARVEPPVSRPQAAPAPAPVDRPLDRLNPPPSQPAPSRPQPLAPLLPPIPGVSPIAPSAGRETIYVQPSSRLELGLAAGLAGVAALMAFVGLSSVRSLGGSILNMVATFVFILICLALAGGLAFQAYALVKVRVLISQTELVANNRIGRPRRVALTDIFSVKLATRHYEIGFGRTHTAEVPYVQVSDGAGFWIDALSGRGGQPPTRDQMAVLDALTMIVATHRPVPPPIDLP